MKKHVLASLSLLLLGAVLTSSGVPKSSVEGAWESIMSIDGFEKDMAEASLFNFPESFGQGRLAIHANASQREGFLAVLDAIPADCLLGQLSDESFDERLYLEQTGDDSFSVLYTLVGTGGADTVAMLMTVNEAQTEELMSLWERRVSEEEAGEEEFDQDFGDE